MKKVLLIAYYYPPLGGIGSQRAQKFARYLPDYGWRPIVLTPECGSYYVDPSLDDGTDRGVEVVRTSALDLSSLVKRALPLDGTSTKQSRGDNEPSVERWSKLNFLKRAIHTWVYIPDGQIGWYPSAVRSGRKLLQTRDIQAIYSTSFPVTAHVIAHRLKRTMNRPWVADFRDLWTQNPCADYSSKLRKRLDQILELKLLENADAIVTVSNTLAEVLGDLTNGRKRIEVIRNGFDSSDFAGIERTALAKWTITFVGSFYSFYNPSPFLAALQRLIERGRVQKEDVQFIIVGEAHPYMQQLVVRFGVADMTRFTGFVSHSEAVRYQINSSLLLFVLHGDGANPGIITGKLYEYVGSRTPILSIVPRHFEAARIIQETGAGVTVEAADVAGIEQCLIDSYLAYKSGVNGTPNECDLSRYERKYGAQQLANLLTELTATESGSH
ncbi:MAG: glycosyltransferase family 4 protein [Acidiferrobacterales bacterium]